MRGQLLTVSLSQEELHICSYSFFTSKPTVQYFIISDCINWPTSDIAGFLAHAAAAKPIAVAASPPLANANVSAVGVAHAGALEPCTWRLAHPSFSNLHHHLCKMLQRYRRSSIIMKCYLSDINDYILKALTVQDIQTNPSSIDRSIRAS